MAFIDRLHIEANGIPIYLQIRDQILAAVGAGSLKPGAQMPTMREVAIALKVDLNTVRHAYESAQESGAVVLVKARGTFVADHPSVGAGDDHSRRLDRFAYQTIAMAAASGIDPAKLALRIAEIAASPSDKGEIPT